MISFLIADISDTASVATLVAVLFEEGERTPDADEIAGIFANILRGFLFCSVIWLISGCSHPARTHDPGLSAYFQPLHPCDTLLVQISNEADTISPGDTIPNHLFFKSVSTVLLREIDYLADSSQSVVLGKYYFPINDNITAYWVDIRLSWYQHHSLLLYNKAKKSFTERITLAEWFGGDGGQVLIGSWLLDLNGDGKKDIVRREIQHSMLPTDDEPLERTEESATLLLWSNGHFRETPLQDTASFVHRFPIQHYWR